MGEASQMLKWMESRLVSKRQFEAMSPEERVDKFPTGVLKMTRTGKNIAKRIKRSLKKHKENNNGRNYDLRALEGKACC